jgi:hypothetical protein
MQTNFDNINTFTAFAEGETFTSEQQVRDYFTAENMREMFGADPAYSIPEPRQLIAWADAVVNNGWHCDFKATTETPTVVARATFKDPNHTLRQVSGDPGDNCEAMLSFVKYGEYITVEFMSDGTARVVPVSELN